MQGFLNALAYGRTRGNFKSVMSLRHLSSQAESPHEVQDSSQGENEKEVTDEGIYGEEWQKVKLCREGSLSVLISWKKSHAGTFTAVGHIIRVYIDWLWSYFSLYTCHWQWHRDDIGLLNCKFCPLSCVSPVFSIFVCHMCACRTIYTSGKIISSKWKGM